MELFMIIVDSTKLLRPLSRWMGDPAVSELMLNRPGEIYVERSGKISKYRVHEYDLITLLRLFKLLARENECVFDETQPLFSGSLLDGSRIQCVLPPVSRYPCFSIRRHTKLTVSWNSLMQPEYFQMEGISNKGNADKQITALRECRWDDFLLGALRRRLNILISGETSSGKTTLLNVLLTKLGVDERLIVLEDTRELEVRSSNTLTLLAQDERSVAGGVDLSSLLRAALRLRPDRLILGELRGGEAYDFVAACQTGHGGSMATIHAASPSVALDRLIQLYRLRGGGSYTLSQLRDMVKHVVDVIIQVQRKNGKRSITKLYYQEHLYGEDN